MKTTKNFLTFSLLMMLSLSAYAGGYTIKQYLSGMKTLGHSCSMSYNCASTFPGNNKLKVSGRLAMANGNYYDSSNSRLVLLNKNWFLIADHDEKIINTVYLPDWKKNAGEDFELDLSGFLLENFDFTDPSLYKLKDMGSDSVMLTAKFTTPEGQTVELQLYYDKESLVPSRYQGKMSYPVEEEYGDGPGGAKHAVMSFDCYNLTVAPALNFFDESRFIQVSNGKAQLRRFNNYRTYKPTTNKH